MESGHAGDGGESAKGVSDNLREAIERTFSATAEAGERAQELLDEVAKRGRGARESVSQRGQGARDALSQRGQDAQEASAGVAGRLVEAVEGMRIATREELRELEKQVAELSRRVAKLESEPRAGE